MNKIKAKFNIRNIQELYNIQNITDNGKILLKDKYIVVYRIDPTNIISCDEETKHKIYKAYLTCIRGLPNTFQIIISKNNANFDDQIIEYEGRIKEIQNQKLKLAIEKYIEYLKVVSKTNKLYKMSHYLIIEDLKTSNPDEINNIFSNLEEFGIRISQVKSKEQVENILRRYILKE